MPDRDATGPDAVGPNAPGPNAPGPDAVTPDAPNPDAVALGGLAGAGWDPHPPSSGMHKTNATAAKSGRVTCVSLTQRGRDSVTCRRPITAPAPELLPPGPLLRSQGLRVNG